MTVVYAALLIAGAGVSKASVLAVSGEGSGGDLARRTIGATEQIHAATGVDLMDIAKRLGG